jgi:sodium-dependent dicarboxylate transporter 2/3/5
MAGNQEAVLAPADLPPQPWFKQLWAIRETLVIILTPILLLPLPIFGASREASCAYVILIMAIYWMTEALPMAVTALLPVVMMPWLDVMSSKQLCQNYLKDANMLFFGGLLIAVAVEKWGLHKRVALRVLMLVGSKPVWILFGFMSVTGFLSMWLSNTACAAMMIPIACAVLKELNEHRLGQRQHPKSNDMEMQPMNGVDEAPAEGANNDIKGATVVVLDGKKKHHTSISESEKQPLNMSEEQMKIQWEKEDKEFRCFAASLKLCVAYASNVGGTGTLIGCGPNIVLKGMADSIYGPDNGIDFTSWFILAFPNMLLDLLCAWLSLVFIFIGRNAFKRDKNDEKKSENEEDVSANAVIRREYVRLGTMTFAEASVMVAFIVLAMLWLFKAPGFMPGWLTLMPYHKEGAYVTDSSVAITICVLLFIMPSEFPNYLCFGRCHKNTSRPPGPAKPLLDWPTVNKQMPWSVILLLGGGFALADACKESGLSKAIGNALISFQALPPALVVLIMVVIATAFTTFTSNVSTTTILLPITSQLANAIQVNPLYLMLPVTISASFSYILPVSTPPNAIVYAYGDITMMDMIKTGLVNCAIHIALLQLAINTWGYAFFDLGTYPSWAPLTIHPNATLAMNGTDVFLFTTPAHNITLSAL